MALGWLCVKLLMLFIQIDYQAPSMNSILTALVSRTMGYLAYSHPLKIPIFARRTLRSIGVIPQVFTLDGYMSQFSNLFHRVQHRFSLLEQHDTPSP